MNKIKIIFIADGRSPTTLSWLSGIAEKGYEIHLVSSYPCQKKSWMASVSTVPLAFSGLSTRMTGLEKEGKSGETIASVRRSEIIRLLALQVRYWLGPLMLRKALTPYFAILKEIQPQIVHALRIPFEGMLAAHTPPEYPVVISTWGNDFTLHAVKSPMMRWATHHALRRAEAVTADCHRDLRLALEWGLRQLAPRIFAPGNGGLELAQLRSIRNANPAWKYAEQMQVINPRGIRPAYVRNDVFFQAVPLVLEVVPGAKFICPAMADQPDPKRWIAQYRINDSLTLLPPMDQEQLWELYAKSNVVVSPAIHDGTPNSLLEAMAIGCTPVAGDIESIREWIVDGRNGVLVDARSARSVADGIIQALTDKRLQQRARENNTLIVANRADKKLVMTEIDQLYQVVISRH